MAAAKKKEASEYVEYSEGKASIELSRPLKIAGANVTHMQMREPTVRDQLTFEKMKGSEAEREMTLLGNLCEFSPEQLQELPVRDYRRLAAAYQGFTD